MYQTIDGDTKSFRISECRFLEADIPQMCARVGKGLIGITFMGYWAFFRKLWLSVVDAIVWHPGSFFMTEKLDGPAARNIYF